MKFPKYILTWIKYHKFSVIFWLIANCEFESFILQRFESFRRMNKLWLFESIDPKRFKSTHLKSSAMQCFTHSRLSIFHSVPWGYFRSQLNTDAIFCSNERERWSMPFSAVFIRSFQALFAGFIILETRYRLAHI